MEHPTYYSGCKADGQQHNKVWWNELVDVICLLLEREFVAVRNGNEN
jgi:hypothetical protein